eukprot:980979_1
MANQQDIIFQPDISKATDIDWFLTQCQEIQVILDDESGDFTRHNGDLPERCLTPRLLAEIERSTGDISDVDPQVFVQQKNEIDEMDYQLKYQSELHQEELRKVKMDRDDVQLRVCQLRMEKEDAASRFHRKETQFVRFANDLQSKRFELARLKSDLGFLAAEVRRATEMTFCDCAREIVAAVRRHTAILEERHQKT